MKYQNQLFGTCGLFINANMPLQYKVKNNSIHA